MTFYREIPFAWEGENYQIKIFFEEKLINIVAFKNKHPANGIRHQILIPKYASVNEVLANNTLDEFVEMCKKDISEKRWERLIPPNPS